MTARERSRRLEELAVQEAALDLTLEKRYGGFTMDDLAQRTGMPRRTLFQRVGDKMSAVVGVEDPALAPSLESDDATFSPFDAYLRVALQLVERAEVHDAVVAVHAKLRQAMVQEPRLAAEVARRATRNLEIAAEMLRDGYGWPPDDPRPDVLSRVTSALVEGAIARVLAAHEDGRSLDLGDELRSMAEALRVLL